MSLKKLAAGAALTVLAQVAATAAHAQSTGTETVQELVVTATHAQPLGGLVADQEAPKTRDIVSQSYMMTQVAGANAMSDLNLVPGVNYTQDDPFGLAGSAGHITIRGLKNQNIGEMEDGMPLNDAGNYAVYAGERLDPEVLGSVNIITGSSEVDAPSASSLGGTINYDSLMPSAKYGGLANVSVGSFGEQRYAALIQTGEIGPWGTKGWIEGSYTQDNKYTTAFGRDYKWQVNGRVYQDLHHEGDFVSVAVFYDRQLLSNYDGVDFATSGNPKGSPYYGVAAGNNLHGLLSTPWNSDYSQYFVQPATASGNTYFQGLQLNPTYTGNIRGQFRYTLLPNLKLTVDPSYQWILATGGTLSTTTQGTNALFTGAGLTNNKSNYPACFNSAGVVTGLDLDGATSGGAPVCSDTVRVTEPSLTQTDRYSVSTNLIWTPLTGQLVQLSYAYDHANVRQTGEYAAIQSNGWPTSVFSGLQGWGTPILDADGNPAEKRNRLTLATLNQISLEYIGKFLDDHLRVDLGVRDPWMSRTLSQYCYTSPPTNVLCTEFPSVAAQQKYTIAPFNLNKTYNQPLPNVGATWNFDQANSVFIDYTQALNAPINDDLYAVAGAGAGALSSDNVKPETSSTIEGGYRFQTGRLRTTIDGYYIEDNNHIVSAYNQELDLSVDTNVGAIHFYGFEGQVGWVPIDHLTLVGSIAYEHSEVMSNTPYSATFQVPTAGKQFYDTPPWMVGGSATYDWNYFTFGGQFKYVDVRQVTGMNDLQVPAYTTVDFYTRVKLDFVRPGTYAQFNVNNLFNDQYIGSISYYATNRNNVASGLYSEIYAYQGAPRTVQFTLHAEF